MVKLTVKKYDGDDRYSYAVFKAEDVKGMGSIIHYGEAKPIACGMGRDEAKAFKERMERRQREECSTT